MVHLDDDLLALCYGAPLVAAGILFAMARAPGLWLRLVGALLTHLAVVVIAANALRTILARGGFAMADVGGYVGARIEDDGLAGLVPAVLVPSTAPMLLMVVVAGALAAMVLWPRAARERSSSGHAAILLATGACAALVTARHVHSIAAAFAITGIAGFVLLVSFQPKRDEASGAARAFMLHRVGDAALLFAVLVLGPAIGGIDPEKLISAAPHIDAWSRAHSGPLTGVAAREAWLIAAGFIVAAVATRLALFPLLPLVRDATGAPGAALGLAHGVCFLGAGLILLHRMTPLLWLAPEVLQALGWLAAISVLVAGLLAVAARDLVRIDIHLLSAVAALGAFAAAGTDMGALTFATALLIGAAVPLASSTGDVVDATGRTDPHTLGGLEKILPRSHSARLLTTFALFGTSGLALVCLLVPAALVAPWLGQAVAALLLVAVALVAGAGFRPLHLAYTGKAPREPLMRPIPSAPRISTWPPIVVAGTLVGFALVSIPVGLMEQLPLERYRAPLAYFVVPERRELIALREHVLPASVKLDVHPTTIFVLASFALLLGWLVSTILYRGGPGRVHQKVFGGPRVHRAVDALSSLAGRESQVARAAGESAARLSKILATNLAPAVLDAVLRRGPALAAALGGVVVRFLANGSAQRGLIVLLVMLTVLLGWWGGVW